MTVQELIKELDECSDKTKDVVIETPTGSFYTIREVTFIINTENKIQSIVLKA